MIFKRMRTFQYPLLAKLTISFLMGVATFAHADSKKIAIEEMSAYLDFVEYSGATIFAQQIPKSEYAKMFIIDARDAGQYAKDKIPGAVNIEWRQVLSKSSQIPKNKPVLIYCNTGSLSAQAGFALRVAGWDNLRILQGGFEEWKNKGGLEAHTIAAGATPQH